MPVDIRIDENLGDLIEPLKKMCTNKLKMSLFVFKILSGTSEY